MFGRPVGIGAVILAAGASSRMGSAKQVLRFGDESLLRRSVLAAVDAGCGPVVVVTGAHADLARREFSDLRVTEAFNAGWAAGLASSIRGGVEGLLTAEPQISAALFLVCDQPFVTPELIQELVDKYRERGARVIASKYGGSFGVPALFDRSLFAELSELTGVAGAKQVITRHRSETGFVSFPDGEVDVDTPADFARLTAQ